MVAMRRPSASPTRSVWLPDGASLCLPPLAGDLDADVVVVGGGLAGVCCAQALLERGVAAERIVVLEARGIGGRASGRNAGFLLADLAESYARLHGALGERARRLRALSLRNQRTLIDWSAAAGVADAIEMTGVLVVAGSPHEEEELRASAALLEADGFAVDWLDVADTATRLAAPSAYGALLDPAGGGCDPARLVQGLARTLVAAGVRVYERSPVEDLACASDGDAVAACAGGAVRARLAVLATNAWAGGADAFLDAAIRPVRAQMLSFPARQRVLREVVYRNHGFEYFRQDAQGRFHFGGFRQTAAAEETGDAEVLHADVQERLLGYARALYPELDAVEPEHRWAGIMGFSQDGLPLVGAHPGRGSLLLCAGFTGHGLGLAAESARIVAGLAVDGRAEDDDLFRPARLQELA